MRYVYVILSALVLIVGLGQVTNYERYHVGSRHEHAQIRIEKRQMNDLRALLRSYRKVQGRYPSNDEGLLAIRREIEQLKERNGMWACHSFELRVADSGVLSLWGEPLIYENRAGMPSTRFAVSGANEDSDRAYSVQVDRDVYIWSLGGQQANEFYSMWTLRLTAASILIALVSAFVFALSVRLAVRSVAPSHKSLGRRLRVGGAIAVNGLLWLVVVALAVPFAVGPSCYAMQYARRRTPQLTKGYVALITKYRDKGIISERAYKKILDTLPSDDKSPDY